MADIDLERKKSGPAVWPWVAALVALALVVWGITEVVDTDAEVADVEVVEPVAPAATPEAGAAGVGLADILSDPQAYIGQTFPDTRVRVAEVPTDRGFWIEDQGRRLFAIIVDVPQEEPMDINPGQALSIRDGTLRAPSYLDEVEGVPVDDATRSIADGQDVLLVVDERFIEILEAGEPQPGTDPAQGVGGTP